MDPIWENPRWRSTYWELGSCSTPGPKASGALSSRWCEPCVKTTGSVLQSAGEGPGDQSPKGITRLELLWRKKGNFLLLSFFIPSRLQVYWTMSPNPGESSPPFAGLHANHHRHAHSFLLYKTILKLTHHTSWSQYTYVEKHVLFICCVYDSSNFAYFILLYL